MATKKRRIRSPHPGVVLLDQTLAERETRRAGAFHRPGHGQAAQAAARPHSAADSRDAALLSRSARASNSRCDAWSSPARSPRVEAKPIGDAAADYMKSGTNRLRNKTLVTYQLALDSFVEWCEPACGRPPTSRAKLAAFREARIARTKLSCEGRPARSGAHHGAAPHHTPSTARCAR